MFTIGALILGFALGISFYYWYSHRVNPTAAQATVDAAKVSVTTEIATEVAAAETAVKAEVEKL